MVRLARISSVLCFTLAVLCAPARGSAQESLEALRTRADSAAPADCARICIEAARRFVHEAGQQYSADHIEAARKATADAVHFAELGTRASVQTHHHLKDNEIRIREFTRKLGDIKRTLSYDDRAAVDAEVAKLEKLRDQLLEAMFGTPKKSLEGRR